MGEASAWFSRCQIDPIEYVEDICENMQLFPKEDFLTGDQLMFEYDPEVSSPLVLGLKHFQFLLLKCTQKYRFVLFFCVT